MSVNERLKISMSIAVGVGPENHFGVYPSAFPDVMNHSGIIPIVLSHVSAN
jgi:hypothetical protein